MLFIQRDGDNGSINTDPGHTPTHIPDEQEDKELQTMFDRVKN